MLILERFKLFRAYKKGVTGKQHLTHLLVNVFHCLYTLTHCTQHSCSTAKSHSPIRQTIELGKALAQLGKIMKFALLQNIGKCGGMEILYIY